MNWSAFQPERGAFDQAYVARVRQAVRWAAKHDLYVVLDMHQDAWGKHIATPPGTECPPGLGRAVGWDGAPLWATLTDGMTTCRANDTRELAPAVAQAFESFYSDRDGIQTELVTTWGRIAAAFAGEANVIGYDLINEPHPGLGSGRPGRPLGGYYARAIEAIREGEKAPERRPRIVFFEPSVLWSGFGNDALPPAGFTDDPFIVFAPHLYSESISVDQGATSIEQGFDNAERAAATYGAPLWSGEWGWFGEPEDTRSRLERYIAQEDARRLGGAWWVWRQACGDPHVVGYPGASGSLNPAECPSGQPARPGHRLHRPPPPRLPALRARPPDPLTSDWKTGQWSLRGTAGDGECRIEVWVPGEAEPNLAGEGVSDLRVERRPGGWLASGCARGDYGLSGKPGEAAPRRPPPARPGPCRAVAAPDRHPHPRPRQAGAHARRRAAPREARARGARRSSSTCAASGSAGSS